MKSFLPKPIFLSVLFLLVFSHLHAQNAWINEFHYDNVSTDEGEFVEIVLEDAESYDLSLFNLSLYNGSDGETYSSSHSLDTFTAGDTENGYTIYFKNISSIQNGPDAFSLDYNGNLIQFISYEGSFTGVGGPADGESSVDIGVEETTSTPVAESLQLSGSGAYYADFTWQAPASQTKGQLNNGQTLGASCTAPTTQASFSSPTAGDIDDNQITLNWSRGNGDAVVVVVKENEAVNGEPENGTSYTADADLSSGLADEIGTGTFVVYDGSGSSIDVTGLTQGTEYHFSIFEYLTTDHCYLNESETISISTSTAFDEDSKIEAPLTQISSSNISSITNSEIDAVPVFKFVIEDQGSGDGVSTLVNKIVIEKSADNNISDWSSIIKGAKLNDGTVDLSITDLSINQDHIAFDLAGNEFEIADGNAESLTLFIWLEENQIDQAVLGFEIPETNGIEADASGSLFETPISSAITSNPFTIDVEATDYEISTVSSAQVNEAFNLNVSAVDANGNIDRASRNLSLSLNTGSGNLSSPSVGLGPVAMTDGFYEWTDLKYDTEESIIIEISDGNSLTVNTSEIDIIPLITSVFFSEYIEGSSSNKALEIFNNSGNVIDLNDFSIAIYTNGSESVSFEYALSEIQTDLADQENLVIVNTSAEAELKALADIEQFSITNFNGDDALVLLYKGNIIDEIGEIGVDPGSAWNVSGIEEATQDKTLVRKASVTEGNPNNLVSFGNNSFDSEWIVYDMDDFSNLGDHFRCQSPTEQVSNISLQNITENTAELSWDAPVGLNSMVLIKEGSPVDAEPVSGISYTANSDFTQANELRNGNKIVFTGSGESAIISELNDGTNYHIAIYAYEDSCYNITSPAVTNFSTEIALDQDSKVNALAQPEVTSLLSTVDQESEAMDVFSFQISDLATQDTEPTLVKKMVFESHDNNTLAWENTVNAILKAGNDKINNAELSIFNNRIEIDFPENEEYEIPSGESVDFTLSVWFNRFQISDTAQFTIQIPTEHEFVSLNSASAIEPNLDASISSNEIEVVEVLDSIHAIRNGINGEIYVSSCFVSSNDFGLSNSQFYIQKDEAKTYEKGIAIYSNEVIDNLATGNKVKVIGSREEVNGIVRINADTVIILDNAEFIPKTYHISAQEFNSFSELMGTRVEMDSLTLIQPSLWSDLKANILQFSSGEDTVLVKIQPQNIYFDGNAQIPFGAIDLAGIMEKSNDSIQLFLTLDDEISDTYPPIFEIEPTISNINGESVDFNFVVNELSTVYYAVKNVGDSIIEVETLKNPSSDEHIIVAGNQKIDLEKASENLLINIEDLSSNTEYSLFTVAEDTLGNATEIIQLDFFTLNTNADQDVKVVSSSEKIPATNINAFEATQDFIPVYNFTVEDGGTSDELPTYISRMVIYSAAENEVNFHKVFNAVELIDSSNDVKLSTENYIFPDSIVFEFAQEFELNDGRQNSYQLRIKLKERVDDEQHLAFEIPNINTSLEVKPNGSQLADDFGKAVVSDVHQLDVTATEFELEAPAEVYVYEGFNISLTAQDQNGNIDYANRTLNIVVEKDSSFSGQTELSLSNGEGVFKDLSYKQTGKISFEITDGSISEILEINFIKSELVLDTSGFSTDFGLVHFPNTSEIQSYQLLAENLRDSVVVVATEAFKLSLEPDFSTEADTLVFDHETFDGRQIYVRFTPQDSNGVFYQGNIIHISQNADTIKLPITAQEGTLNLTDIASVRDKPIGERVKIQGVVIGGNNHFEDRRIIQDKTAGIAIEGLNSTNLRFGDSVEVEGVLSKIENWLSIIPEKEIDILSSDSVVIAPLHSTISDLNESIAAQRVRIEDLTISDEGFFESKEYRVFNHSDTISLMINSESHPLVGMEIPFEKINITGFIGKSQGSFYIYPELLADLEIIPRDTVLNIEAPQQGLSFGSVLIDYNSEPKRYKLQAQNLVENLHVTASENFEISLLKETNYTNNLILPIDEKGDIPEITIYVRFSPIMARGGALSGKIHHKSGGQEFTLPLNGIEELITSHNLSLSNEITIYPNPVHSELKIELLEPKEYYYQLMGLEGAQLLNGKFNNDHTLDLSQLKAGIYFLNIKRGMKNVVFRIFKN
ncbi:T9SS type A sorting domain-containing protein [Marivirga sp.]|uniref:T9SS type A sorting domain-containing protein n=1 Tax=Marivirga sp. TaxID=2018662 RepID=UPI003DA7A0F9